MKKKTVLIHSNFCKAFTGFGKHKKNIMRYLHETGKYNLIEFANGLSWDAPQTRSTPWTCRGSLPAKAEFEALSAEEKQKVGYGGHFIDRAIKEFKPDIYIGIEDIWAFNGYMEKPWWKKINTMIWTTLDSLPILPLAVDCAPKIDNYYVWSSFAQKAFEDMGYDHVKTLRGSLDTSNFHRINNEDRLKLRKAFNLQGNYVVGYVFRNQLRKSVPNLLDGFCKVKEKISEAKLLLHTHWSEGWDIPRLIEEKGIAPADVLTTYLCKKCKTYHIAPFLGQGLTCNQCGSQGTVHTTNTDSGVTEQQLNEIYNLMDVYCHPFTSGGQEIPIQEAKLAGLITLVTNYSCGEDSCTEESGGLPLRWSEYREPGTQFIKASTDPEDISDKLIQVYKLSEEERKAWGDKARQWVIDNFSIEVIATQLEKIIDSMPEVDYDYELTPTLPNPNYTPKEHYTSKEEFLIDVYKNILNEVVDKNNTGFKSWMKQLNAGQSPTQIIDHFKSVASKKLQERQMPNLEDFLDDDKGRRIGVVIPQSENDVLLVNSLIKNLHKQYEEYNIYVFTKPQYFPYVEDNPWVHKVLPYGPLLENSLALEGVGLHEGSFEMIFHPHATTQKAPCYIHNGLSKNQFSLV
tara:strand:+ start:2634 stop:4520 length:1887 start_codon:yes stop_codon:yes gene_type:complete